jgi:hypothetical protein
MINESILNKDASFVLTNFNDIKYGVLRRDGLLPKVLKKNWEISKKYIAANCQSSKTICAECFLFVSKATACSICGDTFHDFCVNFEGTVCHDCSYFNEGKYKTRNLLANKIEETCRICKEPAKWFCDQCLLDLQKHLKVKRIDTSFLDRTDQINGHEMGICLDSLKKALESQKLEYYTKSVCSCGKNNCNCFSATKALDIVPMSKRNIEMLNSGCLPAVKVFF